MRSCPPLKAPVVLSLFHLVVRKDKKVVLVPAGRVERSVPKTAVAPRGGKIIVNGLRLVTHTWQLFLESSAGFRLDRRGRSARAPRLEQGQG